MSAHDIAEGTRAVLDAVPMASVLIDAQAHPVWANRAARLLSGEVTAGDSRLFRTVAASEPVATARRTGVEARGSVQLPTDVGLIDRIVTAAPLPGADLTLASFASPGGPGGVGQDEVRQRLEAMLEHTREMITVLDRDGIIRFSNAAAGRVTGLAGSEVNGRFAFELIHPDDLDTVAAALTDALARPGPSPYVELRLKYADGSWHDVEAVANNLLETKGIEGVVVSMQDITERKAAQARLTSLIANLSDVIVVLDEEFQITFASNSISQLIEAPPETNVGMSAFNDIHPDDLPLAIDALTRVKEGAPGATVRVEVRLESRPNSKRWRWVEATAVNLLDEPAVNGIVITLRDVTDQKLVAIQLQRAYEAERANAERLAELDRLKDDFLATVSHELRTPLAAIVGFAELLRQGRLDQTMQADVVVRIASSAADMRSMIDNVLDFSALEAGRVSLELETVGVRDVVDAALSTVTHRLAEHVVEIDVGDHTVVADQHGLGHVIRNLLTNAAKYSDTGSTIAVRARRDGDNVVIEVADHGIGIRPDDVDRIFERFYRASSAAFVARGSGIGLNIARRYTQLMGGTLTVTSTLGMGSVFAVALPAV